LILFGKNSDRSRHPVTIPIRTLLIKLPNTGAPTITPTSKAAFAARDVGHCGYSSLLKARPLDFSKARPDSLEFSVVTVTSISAVKTAAEATEDPKVPFRVTRST